jgi:hypothetical protein
LERIYRQTQDRTRSELRVRLLEVVGVLQGSMHACYKVRIEYKDAIKQFEYIGSTDPSQVALILSGGDM